MNARLDIVNEGDVVLTVHLDALQSVHQLCRDLIETEAIAELKLSSEKTKRDRSIVQM